MPKVSKSRKKARHDPLDKQIKESKNPGVLSRKALERAERAGPASTSNGLKQDDFVPERLSRKILQTARAQQDEIDAESKVPLPDLGGFGSNRATQKASGAGGRATRDRMGDISIADSLFPRGRADDGDLSDDDDTNSIFHDDLGDEDEYEDVELSPEDERALEMFRPGGPLGSAPKQSINLADLILEAIKKKEERQAAMADPEAVLRRKIAPEIVECYVDCGKNLSKYRSGKIPKPLRFIPKVKNWEEILFLTNPDKWTPNAVYEMTKLFATGTNAKIAQRFYELVLLDRVRANIEQYKRLNFHLFHALKKAVFKPSAFFKGILLPLTESGASAREAVIFASVLQKKSIPVLQSSAAMLMLTKMEYSGAQMLFLKTLLDKKYSLPRSVLAGLLKYFASFVDDERDMPVVWHQALLTLVQRYKLSMSILQRDSLKPVLRRQIHRQITPEIKRELFGTFGGGLVGFSETASVARSTATSGGRRRRKQNATTSNMDMSS